MKTVLYVLHEGRRIEAHNDTIEATFVKADTNLGRNLISKYKDAVYHSITVSESDQAYVPDITRIIFPVENNKELAGRLKLKAKRQFNVTKQAMVLVLFSGLMLAALTADALNLISDQSSYQIFFALAVLLVADLIVTVFTKKKVW